MHSNENINVIAFVFDMLNIPLNSLNFFNFTLVQYSISSVTTSTWL